jgi:regulator of RNase E activity RraA
MTKLTDATRNKLKTISTATVATALFKRGFRTQCIQDVHPLGADQPTLVGEAFTLRYMPAREDLKSWMCFATAPIRSARQSKTARPARCLSWTAARMPAPRPPAPS